MRIECRSIDDFLANLEGRLIYDMTVYVDRTSNPLNGDKRTASSFELLIQASAVVDVADNEQALVQGGEFCGVDRLTADGEAEGSLKQRELFDRVVAYCVGRGLVVKPGLVDM